MKMSSHNLIVVVLMSAVALVAIGSPSVPVATLEVEPPINVRESAAPLFGITVVINNILERKQNLVVHCKDKNTDFGVKKVPSGGSYNFSMEPNLFSADYFCSFVFDNVVHWFDIYLWKRDFNSCNKDTCRWFVYEKGICLSDPNSPTHCYSWNRV